MNCGLPGDTYFPDGTRKPKWDDLCNCVRCVCPQCGYHLDEEIWHDKAIKAEADRRRARAQAEAERRFAAARAEAERRVVVAQAEEQRRVAAAQAEARRLAAKAAAEEEARQRRAFEREARNLSRRQSHEAMRTALTNAGTAVANAGAAVANAIGLGDNAPDDNSKHAPPAAPAGKGTTTKLAEMPRITESPTSRAGDGRDSIVAFGPGPMMEAPPPVASPGGTRPVQVSGKTSSRAVSTPSASLKEKRAASEPRKQKATFGAAVAELFKAKAILERPLKATTPPADLIKAKPAGELQKPPAAIAIADFFTWKHKGKSSSTSQSEVHPKNSPVKPPQAQAKAAKAAGLPP